MTKEQFERAKEIEDELMKLIILSEKIQKGYPQKMEGLEVDLTPAWLKYQVDALRLFNERKAVLEAEFVNL